MKKLLYFIAILLILTSCGGDNGGDTPTPKPNATLKEQVTKTWVAQTVKEDNILVYQRGGTSNIKPGYTALKLELKSGGDVSFTEIGGTVLNGKWSLSSDDKKLTLLNLVPVPSETSGSLDFTILTGSDKNLNISGLSKNYKTGGTQNVYELVPN